MKKFGFTMAELLTTLGIIGVVAAITVPMANNLMPDKNKVAVLKAHKNLTEINHELLNDNGLYFNGADCIGFECTATPSQEILNARGIANWPAAAAKEDKYPILLWTKLNVTDIKDIDLSAKSHTLPDGTTWTVDSVKNNSGNLAGYKVTVDINTSSKGKNCSYSANCTKPDSFILNVQLRNGTVTGGDALTLAYLANPHKFNTKKDDLKTAKKNLFSNTSTSKESWEEKTLIEEGLQTRK